MTWFRRMVRHILLGRHAHEKTHSLVNEEREKVERTMATAVVFAMGVQDSQLSVMDHSARVALVAEWIAKRAGIHDADRYILQLAARLHELGMFAVPPELLHRPAPLSTEELETVRSQARMSAEVARLVHPPRVADLIENQYEDHRRLARGNRLEDRQLFLAGILRVADVYAAVTWPRPYQDPMPTEFRDELLQRGAGTQFHPLAVESALAIAGEMKCPPDA